MYAEGTLDYGLAPNGHGVHWIQAKHHAPCHPGCDCSAGIKNRALLQRQSHAAIVSPMREAVLLLQHSRRRIHGLWLDQGAAHLVKKVEADGSLPVHDINGPIAAVQHQRPAPSERKAEPSWKLSAALPLPLPHEGPLTGIDHTPCYPQN